MMRRLSGAFLAALLVAQAAAPVFSKPPDLPKDPKIVVGPQPAPDSTFFPVPAPSYSVPATDPAGMTQSLLEVWTTSLFLDVDPLLGAWEAEAEPEAAQPESVCPYQRQQSATRSVHAIANPEQFRSVIENLRALEAASAQQEKQTGSAEEQEAEGSGCCCCGLLQFGSCWMSQLADWCKEQQAKQCSAPASVCPKCELLHAQYVKKAGIEEQVKGLMKACYLAVGEERFEKAADLARQAYALDPERVAGDPIVYKMHLLAEQGVTSPETSPPTPPAWRPNP